MAIMAANQVQCVDEDFLAAMILSRPLILYQRKRSCGEDSTISALLLKYAKVRAWQQGEWPMYESTKCKNGGPIGEGRKRWMVRTVFN